MKWKSKLTLVNTRISCQLVQLGIDDLLSLLENLNQVIGFVRVTRCEKCIRSSGALRPSGSPDTMNIVLGVGRIVQIYHKFDVFHICAKSLMTIEKLKDYLFLCGSANLQSNLYNYNVVQTELSVTKTP